MGWRLACCLFDTAHKVVWIVRISVPGVGARALSEYRRFGALRAELTRIQAESVELNCSFAEQRIRTATYRLGGLVGLGFCGRLENTYRLLGARDECQ